MGWMTGGVKGGVRFPRLIGCPCTCNAFASVKMEIALPIEFLVEGTPASLGAKRPSTKEGWKDRVKKASSNVIQQPHFASRGRISVTIYYFPARPMPGDVDNIAT